MNAFPDKIMIVDDEPAHVEAILRVLSEAYPGCVIKDAPSLEGYRLLLKTFQPDILLIDLNLPDGRAVDVLGPSQEERTFPVLIMTSYGSEKTAVEAMKAGAINYIVKSHDAFAEIPRVIERTLREWILIKERAMAITELRQSEEIFRQIAENSQDVFWLLNPSTAKLMYVSPSYSRIFHSPAEILYDDPFSWTEMVHPDDRENVIKNFNKGLNPGVDIEVRIVIPGKGIRWIWARTFPIFNDTGVIERILGVASDITDRKEVEDQRLVIQKLESIGVLAGGIAHDFNNLLTAIMGNISLARSWITKDNRVYKLLSNAETASLRAADLTKRLITFAKGGEPLMAPVSIQSLVEDSAGLFLAGSNVACTLKFPQGLWPVMADEGQIRQVFQNIIINAREAMPEGGNIIISAENLNNSYSLALPAKGKYVRISIQDSGKGIQPDIIPHIFDPYFSTKSRGTEKGTGLGLAVAFSIISKHNGALTVESVKGGGTVFFIYLPAAEIINNEHADGMIRLLFMDDEELIKIAAGQILTGEGYDVVLSDNGRDAVEKYRDAEESGNPFKLVILDLTVPGGMGGVETLRALLKIDPSVKAIVTSGYLEDPVMSGYREYGFVAALAKPFTREDLLEIISTSI